VTGKRTGKPSPRQMWTPGPRSPEEASSASTAAKCDGKGSYSGDANRALEASTGESGFGDDLGGTSEFLRNDDDDASRTLSSRARSAPRLSKTSSVMSTTPRVRKQELSVLSLASTKSCSEFGKDHKPSFSSASRALLDKVSKSPEGPEFYVRAQRLYSGALDKKGAPQFGRDTRRTLEGMRSAGQDGPGSGRYAPQRSDRIRGGSIGTSSRFRNRTPNRQQEQSPRLYAPSYHCLSNFK
jgi:hypothetical protein